MLHNFFLLKIPLVFRLLRFRTDNWPP